LPTSRSTATWSFQSSVASSRIRAATGAQPGATRTSPAIPGIRRASASRFAAPIIGHPALQNTTGYAALRFEVADADGGAFEQTVLRAYGLRRSQAGPRPRKRGGASTGHTSRLSSCWQTM
jgi:hypothetical protein